MKNRVALIAGGVTLALLVTGIAWASQDSTSNGDDSSSSTVTTQTTQATSSTPSTSTTAAVSPSTNPSPTGESFVQLGDGQATEFVIAEAGFVTIGRTGGTLQVVGTSANAGWTIEVEVAQGREVEGDFRNGARRVKFNFELENGIVRVRIESENSTAGSTSTTTAVATTSTTINAIGAPAGSVTYDLDGAGTVTVIIGSGTVTIGSINPAAGWTVDESEQKGNEIEVKLTNGEQEAELKVELEGGQLKVEIERDDRD